MSLSSDNQETALKGAISKGYDLVVAAMERHESKSGEAIECETYFTWDDVYKDCHQFEKIRTGIETLLSKNGFKCQLELQGDDDGSCVLITFGET